MFRRDEDRIIVGHHQRRVRRQAVQHVVRIAAVGGADRRLTDARAASAARGLRNAFQDEGVQAVVRVRIRASQSFVEQQRQSELVGLFGGVSQR